jgi:hypothetical protein
LFGAFGQRKDFQNFRCHELTVAGISFDDDKGIEIEKTMANSFDHNEQKAHQYSIFQFFGINRCPSMEGHFAVEGHQLFPMEMACYST